MHFDIDDIRARLQASTPMEAYDTGAALRALARPRMSGTDAAAEVRADVRERLEGLDYRVEAMPFRFSAWPGRFALPAAGVLLLLGIVGATVLLATDLALTALVVLLLAGALVGGVAYAAPRLVDRLPWGRVEGENLLAQPAGQRPRWLVLAHVDTKSQLLPLSLRAIGPVTGVLAWLVLVVLSALAAAGLGVPGWLLWVTAAAAAGGSLLTALSWASNASPGALDNASGVAALLAVAARERAAGDVAFLITDGEELGLCGARAAAGDLPRVAGAVNLDGLDDHGTLYVVERFGWPRRGLAAHLAVAVMSAATAMDEPVRRRDLPLGMYLDHIALARAGIPAISLLRGDKASVRRVHRPADDVSHLDGSGAARVAEVVSVALESLRVREAELSR